MMDYFFENEEIESGF